MADLSSGSRGSTVALVSIIDGAAFWNEVDKRRGDKVLETDFVLYEVFSGFDGRWRSIMNVFAPFCSVCKAEGLVMGGGWESAEEPVNQ